MIAPGDSGGGLFIGDLLAGITSFGWGRLDGHPNSDCGWTRVSMLNPWIDGIIAGFATSSLAAGAGVGFDLAQAGLRVDAPEPATLAILGLAGLGVMRRRRAG